jgi:hypothetical protein
MVAQMGCESEDYRPLSHGYGELMRGSDTPHSPWSVSLVCDKLGLRKVIWEDVSAGFGDPLCANAIVTFVGNVLVEGDTSSKMHIFVADEGPPAVDASDFIMSIAAKESGTTNLRFDTLEANGGIGVSFVFQILDSFGNAQKGVRVLLTWEELRLLVLRGREFGSRNEYSGVTYYTTPSAAERVTSESR